MRIVFLCKRRYMGKDVVDDRYARLYEIPRQLALLGHDVLVACIGYQGQTDGEWEHTVAGGGRLRLRSRGVRAPWLFAMMAYPHDLLAELRRFRPDIVFGASDIPNIALARWLSAKLGAPLATDLYDNFESFGQAKIPGMIGLLRRSVRGASVVTTTSEALAGFIREQYQATGKIIAVPSTIDHAVFHHRDKIASRQRLGLPDDALLIGTAGGLHRSKGIGELFEAWEKLRCDPRVHLVLAGPTDGSIELPVGERVHYLGQLPHESVATFFSALDVATVCVLDTPFGRYCFPQKAYEILAAGTTVVASDVGAMHDLLSAYPSLLYSAGSPDSLADCVQTALSSRMRVDVLIEDWTALVGRIEPALRAATNR
jgi:glycosyltransferase involved in cell wall biosynthesis